MIIVGFLGDDEKNSDFFFFRLTHIPKFSFIYKITNKLHFGILVFLY